MLNYADQFNCLFNSSKISKHFSNLLTPTQLYYKKTSNFHDLRNRIRKHLQFLAKIHQIYHFFAPLVIKVIRSYWRERLLKASINLLIAVIFCWRKFTCLKMLVLAVAVLFFETLGEYL
jgi:hypothetical protein